MLRRESYFSRLPYFLHILATACVVGTERERGSRSNLSPIGFFLRSAGAGTFFVCRPTQAPGLG